jgi:hypothetical protein
MNLLYIILGHLFLLLGLIGIPTPVLPTTPFLLLAAFFYSKGSVRFHQWLIHHPKLGPPIGRWQKHGIISKKAKYLAIPAILLNAAFPIFFIDLHKGLKITVGVISLLVIAFIASRPSTDIRSEK